MVQEQVGVSLDVVVGLGLNNGVVHAEEADEAVDVLVAHVKVLVGSLSVEDGQILAEKQVLVELGVLQLDIMESL